MGTVTSLRADRQTETLGAAVGAYLASINRPESRGTHRQYAATLRRFRAALGADAGLARLDGDMVRTWIEETWGDRKPATYNRAIDVFRSAWAYWMAQGWAPEDPTAPMRRRTVAADRSRALSRADVGRLLAREDISLRDKTLWRLAYESAARVGELLALNVEDLDLANRRARVIRKGGAADVIVWQSGTARLLPRLVKGRKSGPLFLTGRKARVRPRPAQLPPGGRAVHQCHEGHDWRTLDAAPAAPQRADSRGRGRRLDEHPAGLQRAHLGPLAGQVREGLCRGAGQLAGAARPGAPPVERRRCPSSSALGVR